MRPRTVWLLLLLFAALVFGAMGWMTRHVLASQKENQRLLAEAALQERARLALARMDTAAAPFLLAENERPPSHYSPFSSVVPFYPSTFSRIPGIYFSPLLHEETDFALLHFELLEKGISSPQVPSASQRDLALANGITPARLRLFRQNLARLEAFLAASPGQKTTNRQILFRFIPPLASPSAPLRQIPSQNPADRKLSSQSAEYQSQLTIQEQTARGNTLQKNIEKAVQRSKQKETTWNSKAKAAKTKNPSGKPSRKTPLPSSEKQTPPPPEKPAPAPTNPPAPPPETPSPGPASAAPTPATLEFAEPLITPFRLVWVSGELFALRRVIDTLGVSRLQGIWLDSAALENTLLENTRDLLPRARLQPLPTTNTVEKANDPHALIALPWRLLPGETARPPALRWTPAHSSLALGWAAALLGFLALAALLRGVLRLSERRAAFVSSVTHELRTPLTTFRLYSEMLAEGMIAGEKKKDYLQVMQGESERLDHLVENVLAYSRIERGTARSQVETLTLGALLDRLAPVLDRRAAQENARLEIQNEHPGGELTTDVTAVEQILFNLVDNACKYGLPPSLAKAEKVIRLHAEKDGSRLLFHLTDPGEGVPAREAKKLFRPFHKSAADSAARGKPGVGLGLALSRRLARALGGDLLLQPRQESQGAAFTLELPG